MGSWGTKPFENDGALDLKDEWEESGNYQEDFII